MKSAAIGFIIALVLFGVAVVASSEARLTRRVAVAHQKLATLKYEEDVNITGDTVLDRLPLPGGSAQDLEEHNRTVQYWVGHYDELKPLTGATGLPPSTDPHVLFIAANAAFRASHPEAPDKKGAAARLDTVIQEYADVLRADPENVDAAFNYEFVVRLRDLVARNRPLPKPFTASTPDVSADLPTGPTLHGRAGFPPAAVPLNDFKIISPMRFDEREEQAQPGRGKIQQRRG
jgi:hypothetical protein